MSLEFPIGDIESVIVARGAVEGTDWISLGINIWGYNVDPKTYAIFSQPGGGTIGGAVTGLVGTGLVLQVFAIDQPIEGSGPFVFEGVSFPPGESYNVTV
jgi:hypothetical protein